MVAVDAVPEAYVPEADLPGLVRALALRPTSAEPDLVLRIPREVWPFAEGRIGPAALAADLLESDEPRGVSAGVAWLNSHLDQIGGRRVG